MKKFERIFIYSILTMLVCGVILFVFLIDNNAESQVVIQEEIRARNIIMIDDQGNEILKISANKNGGIINIYSKAGKCSVEMAIDDDGFGYIIIHDSRGFQVY